MECYRGDWGQGAGDRTARKDGGNRTEGLEVCNRSTGLEVFNRAAEEGAGGWSAEQVPTQGPVGHWQGRLTGNQESLAGLQLEQPVGNQVGCRQGLLMGNQAGHWQGRPTRNQA